MFADNFTVGQKTYRSFYLFGILLIGFECYF